MTSSLLEMAKDLVQAQIQSGNLSSDAVTDALRQTYDSLYALRAQEETGQAPIPPASEPPVHASAPLDWRQSIQRHAVTCLECGSSFKLLSSRHLAQHDLDARSYREKYGIPRSQSLAAKGTTARRRRIAQETRPWEKAPRYVAAQQPDEAEAEPAAPKARAKSSKAAASRSRKTAKD